MVNAKEDSIILKDDPPHGGEARGHSISIIFEKESSDCCFPPNSTDWTRKIVLEMFAPSS